MPARKQDAYKALELMEQYLRNLEGQPGSEQLHDALCSAIVAIRSRLFQALLDIQEFYEYTLDNAAKSVEVKTAETKELTDKWNEHDPPIPVEARKLGQITVDATAPSKQEKAFVSKEPDQLVVDEQPQSTREEVVVIERDGNSGLGLSIAGGTDNPHTVGDYGIFVTGLTPGSVAEQCGLLQLGDQILAVNEDSLLNVTHNEAVTSLKTAGTTVELRIKRFLDRVWTPASPLADNPTHQRELSEPPRSHPPRAAADNVLEVRLTKDPAKGGLGFSIAGGMGNEHVVGDHGIFVTKILEGLAADEEGTLAVGDRIMEVDGKSMEAITHDDAVSVLKGTGQTVVLKIEKNAMRVSPSNSVDQLLNMVPPSVAVAAAPVEDVVDKPRIITLTKQEGSGLGFNIIGGEEEVGIFISVISPEGAAADNGELKVGDMILQVNGEDINGWSHETAAQALKTAGDAVTLKVVYKPEEFEEFYRRMSQVAPVKQLYVRSLVDYDSNKDADRPGEGLSYRQGDILHVLNGDDDEWWQAALVGPHANDEVHGLVPSKGRLERRARANAKTVKFGNEEERRGSNMSAKLKNSFKIKRFGKKASTASVVSEEDTQEEEYVPTYEPVALQRRGYARPVIILGPLKEDVNDKLVNEFPDKFAGCVPHTTRKARQGEVDGRDYHFVTSVEQMERDIQAHLFIEAGRYKDNLYGTSIQAVKEVALQHKHCILGVSGFAIRRLVMADLLPIAICISPNSVDVIRKAQPRISDEQAETIFEKGRGIQQEFADSFTAVVGGDSLDQVYNKIKDIILSNSSDFIWVPSNESL